MTNMDYVMTIESIQFSAISVREVKLLFRVRTKGAAGLNFEMPAVIRLIRLVK